MAKRDTLWTCVGITKNVGIDSGTEVVKVRCGVDIVQRTKSSQSKTYTKIKGEYTNCLRNEFVSLPTPMLRVDALKYALAAPEFSSAEDQALIQDQIDTRTPKAPRVKKEKVVKVKASKTGPSIDSIRSRARKPELSDVLAVVAEKTAE
jgi:hypothetical protein